QLVTRNGHNHLHVRVDSLEEAGSTPHVDAAQRLHVHEANSTLEVVAHLPNLGLELRVAGLPVEAAHAFEVTRFLAGDLAKVHPDCSCLITTPASLGQAVGTGSE